MVWDGKIGPATVVATFFGVIQSAVLIVGGIVTVARMQDGIDAARQSVVELKSAVTTMQNVQIQNAERTTKIETTMGFVEGALRRLDDKMDRKIP